MLRLAKYLRPYLLLIVLAIGLLFAQAMADLALPNYMSDIVNVGIQQGGIQSAVPSAIRQSEMNRLFLFMSADQKSQVLSDYTLVDTNSANYSTIVKQYPDVANEPIYVLNNVSQTEVTALDPIMGKAMLVVYTIEQAQSDPAKAAQLSAQLGIDLSKLPAGTNLFTIIQQLPAAQLTQITAAIDKQFAAFDTSTLTQAAATAVKAEYTALGVDVNKIQNNYLFSIGGLMLLVTLASVSCSIIVGLLSARIGSGAARDVRHDLFAKVESFAKADFDRFSTASLITRSTNDITQVQMVVILMLRFVFYAPILGIGAVIRAVDKSPSMTWIIGLGIGILLVLILSVFSISLPRFRKIQKLTDRLNLVTRENLSGMMVIRAFNTQNFESARFDRANTDITQNNLFVSRVFVTMMPVMMMLMNGLTVLILWTGAHQVANLTIQVGDMIAFMQYAIMVVFSFLMLSMMFIFLPRASVSGDRIAEVLAVTPSIQDPAEPRKFPSNARGEVEFRNVSFRYPGAEEDLLHDINFTAKPGQTTAIIGSTGSGKSSVINLIPRFFDVSQGAVLVDGIDVREVGQHDLRDRIGYIPQRGTLFSGTVESNLRYADENASMETLRKATDIAQATSFVEAMDGGMEAEISQGGKDVSGGQKQRLAIARALVKHPDIYIFDDALSALDFKTDSALRRALKKETGQSTMIIVTQRVSTIKNAEQIIVIDDGKIVGKGTHDELMKTNETYREIASSQLTAEELE